MPVSVERMGDNDFSVPLHPDTPTAVLDAVAVDAYAFSRIIVTPMWWPVGTFSTSTLVSLARFVGIYLDQTDDGLNLDGAGLEWLLGGENDGGELYVGTDAASSGPFTLSAQLDAVVFPTNGLTKGSVNASANTRTITKKRGTTRRQFLDMICAIYQNGASTPSTTPYEYQINNDGTTDVDIRSNLYSTTPSVILTDQGGRDSSLTGLQADIDLPDKSAQDMRSVVYANWDDASALGSTTNTFPATYVDIAGAGLDYWSMVSYQPRKDFRALNKWSVRVAANHYAMWVVASAAQATQFAVKSANDVNTIYYDVTADVDEYDPGRFIWPGDAAYTYDLRRGLFNTSNETYYRGHAIHPKNLRVEGMTFPIQRGMGVYMIRSDGGGGFLDPYDLTPYVQFEEDTTTIQLGTRTRLGPRPARPRHINFAALRRNARQAYIGAQYAQSAR